MSAETVVQAEDLVEELTRETDEPVYTLHGAQISGKLDLKHRIINIALDIQGCEFLDEVDFRNCEFKQAVDLSGCIFRQEFNSGDPLASLTTYRKDFICNGAIFEDAVNFRGSLVEGNTFFAGTNFESIEEPVDFGRASFEGVLVCSGAIFKGPASFQELKCNRGAFFDSAKFESEQGVDFAYTSVGMNLECQEATFRGPVSFHELKCNGYGLFGNTKFQSKEKVDFTHASFGMSLMFNEVTNEATFQGSADNVWYFVG